MQKEIYSQNRQVKAVITHRDKGFYSVEIYRWVKEVVPEFAFESDYFWEPISKPSLTDTYENAVKIATDELNAWRSD
jgi:hypothetical protein